MTISVRSSAFQEGGLIPAKYTCDGDDVSPPLEWTGIPQGTKSLALICDDPDAPVGTWVHWVMLLKAMKGHILAEGQLMGKYRRQ